MEPELFARSAPLENLSTCHHSSGAQYWSRIAQSGSAVAQHGVKGRRGEHSEGQQYEEHHCEGQHSVTSTVGRNRELGEHMSSTGTPAL